MFVNEAKARAGRIGGYRRAALNDSRELGRLGQAGLVATWYAEVDAKFPDISSLERDKRVALLRRAYFVALRGKRTAKARQTSN